MRTKLKSSEEDLGVTARKKLTATRIFIYISLYIVSIYNSTPPPFSYFSSPRVYLKNGLKNGYIYGFSYMCSI